MQIFLTVVSGFAVFVLGQIALKWFVEPAQEMRKRISTVQHVILRWDDALSGGPLIRDERRKELVIALESAAADLRAGLYIVPYYNWVCRPCNLPTRELVESATRSLIGLSNGLGPDAEPWKNRIRVQRICAALGINVPEAERIEDLT